MIFAVVNLTMTVFWLWGITKNKSGFMLLALIWWSIALLIGFAVIIHTVYVGLTRDQVSYERLDSHTYALTGTFKLNHNYLTRSTFFMKFFQFFLNQIFFGLSKYFDNKNQFLIKFHFVFSVFYIALYIVALWSYRSIKSDAQRESWENQRFDVAYTAPIGNKGLNR